MWEMMRDSEGMKIWLFDLAHGNQMTEEEIIKGFIKHYVLHGLTTQNIADDIHFKTQYGDDAVRIAMERLSAALNNFCK